MINMRKRFFLLIFLRIGRRGCYHGCIFIVKCRCELYGIEWRVFESIGALFLFSGEEIIRERVINMKPLIKELLARKQKLEAVIRKAEEDLKGLPEGKVWVATIRGTFQYYQKNTTKDGPKKRYLSSRDSRLIDDLAQRDYLMNLLSAAKEELMDIDYVLSKRNLFRTDDIHAQLHDAKRARVKPVLINDEEFAEWWRQQPFPPYDKYPEELKYPTKRGEMVRTKSEAILADAYYDLGIPYRYECPVKLCNGEVRHPDFTLLDASKRKVIYHEHLGMLDDSGYRRDNMQKLDLYRKSGIYVGNNLILTHETAGSPLNIRVFKQNLKEMFEL